MTGGLRQMNNREVTIVNAMNNIKASPQISKERLDAFSSALVVPLGLALESFN